MAETAEKTDPALWEKVKNQVTKGEKGGKPGQWSARKAQLAVHDYKAAGGGYRGGRAADTHLAEWTREDWGTKSGDASGDTGERYLPKQARDALSDVDYKRTTAKKRADSTAGRQFSAQPADVAAKTAAYRGGLSRDDLIKQASLKGIKGRSRMTKAQLEQALRGPG